MKKFSIILSFLILVLFSLYALHIISEANECTSVRAFICDR